MKYLLIIVFMLLSCEDSQKIKLNEEFKPKSDIIVDGNGRYVYPFPLPEKAQDIKYLGNGWVSFRLDSIDYLFYNGFKKMAITKISKR